MVTGNRSLLPPGLPDKSFVNAISNFYSTYFLSHLHFPYLLVGLNELQQENNNFSPPCFNQYINPFFDNRNRCCKEFVIELIFLDMNTSAIFTWTNTIKI